MRLAAILVCLPGFAQDFAYFEKYVRPVLAEQCYACHSGKAKAPFAGLRVDSREALLKGGDHGPAIVPGDPARSRLIQAVKQIGLRMPPSGKLPDETISALERWIAGGAPWPASEAVTTTAAATAAAESHWAWAPLAPLAPGQSIDAFITARLRAAGLSPSPPASPRTLLRRLHYDLTGLPPDAAAIEAFERDPSPQAYAAIADRLLDSPQFGERWARHWMDVVRFAGAGVRSVRFAYAHEYRNWLIQAFRNDMPVDRFVQLQLAADTHPAATRADFPALGLLTLGFNPPRRTELPEKVDDRIDVITRGLLGLTVTCARCHDHKFDPIPTRDYYSLYGVIANTEEPIEPVPVSDAADRSEQGRQYGLALEKRREALDNYLRERLAEMKKEFGEPAAVERYMAAVKESREFTGPQVDALAKERNLNTYMLHRWRRHAAEGGGAPFDKAWPLDIPIADYWQIATEGDFNTMSELTWRYQMLLGDYAHRGAPPHAMAARDAASIVPARIFIRGNQHDPGAEAPARFLSILSKGEPEPFRSGSGRLDLAMAITSPRNPIFARVYVNRIWQHLFGEGIVRTPSDFGTRGDKPTHPELLDYLAARLTTNGWSTRKLIREIVLSDTYRQSSTATSGQATDPENRLLWRANRRRMDFESMRDAMLAVSGRLSNETGGPSFDVTSVPAEPRRTIYAHLDRAKAEPLFRTFDSADPEAHTPQRFTTTVPQQALFLMNGPFIAEQSRHLAARAASSDPAERIRALYRLALARSPSQAEAAAALRFANSRQTAAHTSDPDPWLYGWGALDAESGRVTAFRRFGYFVNDAWQGSSMLPDRSAGNATLTLNGGTPGDDTGNAVIRRWVAPADGTVSITGTVAHTLDQFEQRFHLSNGIRAWVISSRAGLLGKWELLDSKRELNLTTEIRRGDTIDFAVDSKGGFDGDKFTWAPSIRAGESVWDARSGFHGPAAAALDGWEQLAQVLLLTNEFCFID